MRQSQTQCPTDGPADDDPDASGAVPTIPDHVWQNAQVRAAFSSLDLGAALRHIRALAGIGQRPMARLTGLTQGYLSSIESGEKNLTNVHKVAFAVRRLGVPVDLLPLGASAPRSPRALSNEPEPGATASVVPKTAAPGSRRFGIRANHRLLRQLQGVLCIRCGVDGGRLYPDGQACTVSPDGSELVWDVQSHGDCMG